MNDNKTDYQKIADKIVKDNKEVLDKYMKPLLDEDAVDKAMEALDDCEINL